MIALLGMYWDISLHIDNGRDPGPLANPSHYLILVGLFGVFSAGVLAMALPVGERPGRAAIRIHDDWYAPVGGVLIAACGAFALIGFPLDDVWHRLFGQDVTLWGPTHLMLIGGAGMTLVGQAVLLAEGMRSRSRGRRRPGGSGRPRSAGCASARRRSPAPRRAGIVGGFLIGLSTFQGEFDFGVPQFRFVFQPFLIALAAGVALVAARLWIGRGGALARRRVLSGRCAAPLGDRRPPVLGETTPSLPLYLGEALCVECDGALVPHPGCRLRRCLRVSSSLSWGVPPPSGRDSELAFPPSWNSDLLPEGLIFAVGRRSGPVGWWAHSLRCGLRARLPRPGVPRSGRRDRRPGGRGRLRRRRPQHHRAPRRAKATVTLREGPRAAAGARRTSTVRIDPPELADGAGWVTVTAWQGNGLHVDRLKAEVADGVDRTRRAHPAPRQLEVARSACRAWALGHRHPGVHARWTRRPDSGRYPRRRAFTRSFQADHLILQRERKQDFARLAVDRAAGGTVLALLRWPSSLRWPGAWGASRDARTAPRTRAAPPRPAGRAPSRPPSPTRGSLNPCPTTPIAATASSAPAMPATEWPRP